MPVGPGRHLSVLVEVAARNYLLKLKGFHPARQLARRLGESLHPLGDHLEEEMPRAGSKRRDRKDREG
jgi:HPr kinase/phosphorylase